MGTKRTTSDVRSSVAIGGKPDMARKALFGREWPDVWSGRALQEVSSSWRQRSCINVSGLWLELFCSGPSWISARVRSHYRTDLNGPVGSPVFACAGKTDPPSLLILSQTSAG